jgi:hypothetical protein
MIHKNRILAAALAMVAALTAPLTVSAQSAVPPPLPSYAHAFVRDPFPYARPVAVAPVRHHWRRHPAYRYPGYAYGAYGYPVYPYPAYGYPVYGYGYPGWYGPSFGVGFGFRFGGCCYGRIGGRRR